MTLAQFLFELTVRFLFVFICTFTCTFIIFYVYWWGDPVIDVNGICVAASYASLWASSLICIGTTLKFMYKFIRYGGEENA